MPQELENNVLIQMICFLKLVSRKIANIAGFV